MGVPSSLAYGFRKLNFPSCQNRSPLCVGRIALVFAWVGAIFSFTFFIFDFEALVKIEGL